MGLTRYTPSVGLPMRRLLTICVALGTLSAVANELGAVGPAPVHLTRAAPALSPAPPMAISAVSATQAENPPALPTEDISPAPTPPRPVLASTRAPKPKRERSVQSAAVRPSDPCDRGGAAPTKALTSRGPAQLGGQFYGDRGKQVVSLSFDDGPSQSHTPAILRILARHNVRASFFLLGERVERMPKLTARIAVAGHDLGNHSWSHPSFRSLWKSQIKREICATNSAIWQATGLRPTLFRPPFGRYAPSAVPVFAGLGMHLVLWSVDAAEWDKPDAAAVANSIVRAAKPGSIILLHDREAITVQALPMVIAGLRARGFAIEPISVTTGLEATSSTYAPPEAMRGPKPQGLR